MGGAGGEGDVGARLRLIRMILGTRRSSLLSPLPSPRTPPPQVRERLDAELEYFDRVTAVSGKLYPVPKVGAQGTSVFLFDGLRWHAAWIAELACSIQPRESAFQNQANQPTGVPVPRRMSARRRRCGS